MEEILTESESKLDGVRQKILQVAQELAGEDMHQFHRAVTTGESKGARTGGVSSLVLIPLEVVLIR